MDNMHKAMVIYKITIAFLKDIKIISNYLLSYQIYLSTSPLLT